MREGLAVHNAKTRKAVFNNCDGCARRAVRASARCGTGAFGVILFRIHAPEPAMPDVFVAKISQFPDGDRRIVSAGTTEIGVFHWAGQFYAYENLCLHQGGPACEGVMMHKVEDVLGADRTFQGQRFSKDEMHFVCPWHGYEYDVKTGECAADRKLKLKSFEVVRRGEDIYVVAE